jgi:uncharacterized protein YbbK (DUF523 family)
MARIDRDEQPIRIGGSSCLLGQQVRYDGGHKRDVRCGVIIPGR